MVGFVVGLVLGAILGVLADRLWSRFENVIRIDISTGLFDDIRARKGFSFTIKNVGSREIPEYGVCLFHPRRGSLFAFHSDVKGPLSPQQERVHQFAVLLADKPNNTLMAWLKGFDDQPDMGSEDDCSAFRMVMKNSDRVLYENTAMGNELTRALKRIHESGDSTGIRDFDWEALQAPRQKGLLPWVRKNRPR